MPLYVRKGIPNLWHVPVACAWGVCSPGLAAHPDCCKCGGRLPPGPCGAACGEGDAVLYDPFDSLNPAWQTYCRAAGECVWTIDNGALRLDRVNNSFQAGAIIWRSIGANLSTFTLKVRVLEAFPGLSITTNDPRVDLIGGMTYLGVGGWSFSAPGFSASRPVSTLPATVGLHYEAAANPWACAWHESASGLWSTSGPAGDLAGRQAHTLTIEDDGQLINGTSYRIDSVCVNGDSVPANCCCPDWPRDFPLDVTLGGSWDGNEIIDAVFDPYCQRWIGTVGYQGVTCDDGLASLEVWCNNPASSTDGLRFSLSSNDPTCNPNINNQPFDLVDCGPPFSAQKTIAMPPGCTCGPVTLSLAEGGSGSSRSLFSQDALAWIDSVRRRRAPRS